MADASSHARWIRLVRWAFGCPPCGCGRDRMPQTAKEWSEPAVVDGSVYEVGDRSRSGWTG